MKTNNRDYEIQWRVRRGATNRLVTLSEYPRHVERVPRDAAFEAFCRSVPGVEAVTREALCYLITVDTMDQYPVQRRIYRWMADQGRHFDTRWIFLGGQKISTYDPLDRVIATWTYRHRGDA